MKKKLGRRMRPKEGRKEKERGWERGRKVSRIILSVLCLHWQTEGKQAYHVGVSTEMASVPMTLQSMMNAFNHLNKAIRALLVDAEDVAEKVRMIPCGWLTSV